MLIPKFKVISKMMKYLVIFGISFSINLVYAVENSSIEYGMDLFLNKANCQACHGWSGDGRKTDNQMPDGANLRESALDREMVVTAIKCGRPGNNMPAFDRLAYSDGRCYGLLKSQMSATPMTDPPATLQIREIDAIVDFLFAKVIKQGAMNQEKCTQFWGSKLPLCERLTP
jgi:hypothetical protein